MRGCTTTPPAAPPSIHRRGGAALRALLAAGLAWSAGVSAVQADGNEDVGYTLLKSFLGSTLPTGQGVSVSMVEAVQGTDPAKDPYFPVSASFLPSVPSDPPSSDDLLFGAGTDVAGVGVNFIDGSNKRTNGVSGHSAGQASVIFGNLAGLAPSVNQVTVYEANHYLNNVLNTNRTTVPLAQNFRVQNHSWIGSFGDTVALEDPQNVKALRRFDYVIDNANGGFGMTAVVGLNNFASMPYLMAHSYNAIAVGRTDGVHSTGLTREDDPAVAGDNSYGPGRSKPDIVAPKPVAGQSHSTSSSTSHVSAIAAMLHQSGAGTDAARAEVMKAVLLAGATKDEFPTWTRSATQPLDDVFGAGEVNVFNSYKIQQGGQFAGSTEEPASAVDRYGWDYRTISAGAPLHYNFSVAEGSRAVELSVLLTWFARVDNVNSGLPSLVDMNLELYNSTTGFKDFLVGADIRPDIDPQNLDSVSRSTVDNVEHIYLRDLAPGDYTLRVSSDGTRDFGLAWRMEQLFDEPTADFNADGAVDGRDFLAWQQNFNTLLGASLADGDADGDGDVDAADGAVLDAAFGYAISLPAMARIAASNVPEAQSIALLLCGLGAYAWKPRRRRRG